MSPETGGRKRGLQALHDRVDHDDGDRTQNGDVPEVSHGDLLVVRRREMDRSPIWTICTRHANRRDKNPKSMKYKRLRMLISPRRQVTYQ